MPWNEPGKGSKDPDQNPWGSGDGGNGPDLDSVINNLRERFGRFGGGQGPLLIIVAIVLLWVLADSWVTINARQVGVVLRFGEFSRIVQPGFHLKFPRPIEDVTKVATTKVRKFTDQVSMLTADENIMHINFNVQYQVDDAKAYLFSMRGPDETLQQASEAAVRAVIGQSKMDDVLSGSGAQLATDTQALLQAVLDDYDCGIVVTDVSFQNVQPPEQVRAAFDDVNEAREDKQRTINLARAYASKIIPEARGQAARVIAQAKGYKAERVALAQGDADRFTQILAQYDAAPKVTWRRLWIETMEDVLAGNRKVVDGSGGRNLLYLPVTGNPAEVASKAPAATRHGPAAAATVPIDDSMPSSDTGGAP